MQNFFYKKLLYIKIKKKHLLPTLNSQNLLKKLKKKKQKWQKDKQKKKDKNSTLAIRVNATNIFGGKKKKKSKDLSGVIGYKDKKNRHYANKYPKRNLKNQCQS